MIAKIGKGANLHGVILYNFQKVEKEDGQIISLNNMPESLNGKYSVGYLSKCFDPYLSANRKTEKTIRHISLNPDPKDTLSNVDYIKIANDYMDEMGYKNQPYVVFKHTDIERVHLHIVTTCVQADGKKIPDYNDHKRSMDVCRNLENKYGLIPATEKQHTGNDKIFSPVEYKKGDIKSQISAVIRFIPNYYHYQTLGTYNALLSLFNISAEEVKGEIHGQSKSGLVYFALDENGDKASNPFKASLFGKQAGLQSLHDHFEVSKTAMKVTPAKSILKNTCSSVLHLTKNEVDFKNQLVEHGINVVVRKNKEGRIYGVTFIDHENRTVWNGSQLGKELSANVFNEYWKEGFVHSHEDSEFHNLELNQNTETADSDHVLHHLFDFIDGGVLENLTESFIEGIGSLIPSSHGDDYEEMAFENRMKKKKKIKRKKI
ncbi:conjugal transfer protein MobB [Sphingobacterium sp. DR205]|uniref:conjugal transfer protein MobB n=1 Tax=Sphingobacterium sp. DR205 TaxID=2713573 RepID=UPI0013E4541F|nr:conjugal transfer protein MobB [Sphingobacterium sp. DR205]QIH34496.1 relaxase/mobilization nuclease domain-containing protein [Sphingobacterium sp. DR205]